MGRILVGVPSSGNISEGTAQASFLPSLRHSSHRIPSCLSAPNFNNLWRVALNVGQRGDFDYFAMLHADITVRDEEEGLRWADILIEEMEKADADFISVPNAIKDYHGLTSSGIGDPSNRWNPFRRFTTHELACWPVTFTAAQVGYEDKFLLHNNALCIWDLRKPLWYVPDEKGSCRFLFNFTEDIRLVNGAWERFQDSEDWAFSRDLWKGGAKTVLTSRITLGHQDGGMVYLNRPGGGIWEHDEATAANWRVDYAEGKAVA